MSGVIPASASRAGVVSRSSHGDTGDVRKSLGFMNTGEADVRLDTLMRGKQHLEVPDNAEAIACAAASSFADIGRPTVVVSSGIEVCSAVLFEASIVK